MDWTPDLIKEVEKEIDIFNEHRGRRKALEPLIVKRLLPPYRKFGRIIEIVDEVQSKILEEIIKSFAKAIIRTLLQRKPRPLKISIIVFKHGDRFSFEETVPKYLISLRVPRKVRKEANQ